MDTGNWEDYYADPYSADGYIDVRNPVDPDSQHPDMIGPSEYKYQETYKGNTLFPQKNETDPNRKIPVSAELLENILKK